MFVLEIYASSCREAINWRLIGNMTCVCWSLVCSIWERRKLVNSHSVFSLFIVVCWVLNKGNVILIYFWKNPPLLVIDIPAPSLYLLSWMPVLSECLSPLFVKCAHVLAVTCGGLSVVAPVTWCSLSKTGSSACTVYKQRQALGRDCMCWAFILQKSVQQHWVATKILMTSCLFTFFQ